MRACLECGKPIPASHRVGRPRLRHPECKAPQYGPAPRTYKWPARYVAIVMAWETGRTATDVGREFGLTRERVRQIVKRAGYDSTRHPRPLPICARCGAAYSGTWPEHVRAAGHEFWSRQRGATDRTRAMAEAYAAGGDPKAIAAAFGVTRTTVYAAANVLYGPLRYRTGKRVGVKKPAWREAAAMLRNGEPNWRVAEATGLTPGIVAQIKRRYVTPRQSVSA